MAGVIAMILAGGRVDELGVLTLMRPKSAVPFGGLYRFIDFPLTNLMRSGIDQVGILSQYRPAALIDHVGGGGPWGLAGRRRGVHILPPYTGEAGADWYRGTADAVYQNIHFIDTLNPDHVLILSGDHVYTMDYGPLIARHEETGADLTMMFKEVPEREAHRFGIAALDDEGRVVRYEEKPSSPFGRLASLTIYLFKRDALVRHLQENARTGRTYQLYGEVVPAMVEQGRVFGMTYDGYWGYARTVEEYFRASMDLVSTPPALDLGRWQVRTNPAVTRPGDVPPARLGKSSKVVDSVLSGGCAIEGEVSECVLSPFVTVKRGATVRRCVLLHEVVIEEGAHVEETILDKWVKVGAGATVGASIGGRVLSGPATAGGRPRVAARGSGQKATPQQGAISVIGRGSHLPDGLRIGKGCVVYPGRREEDFQVAVVPDRAQVK